MLRFNLFFCFVSLFVGLLPQLLSAENASGNIEGTTIEKSRSSIVSEIIAKAQNYVGTPYKYGGITPTGFDCSGFLNFLYGPYIKDLPRRSQDFVSYGREVSFQKLKPGDLLLFSTIPNSSTISHVSLYLGKGQVIHAISQGKRTGIQISDASKGYWNKHLRYARRILPD